ncbi:hypothetical protein SISNIDRAFT_491549 [Sistotremastrum niveocremeum HHB9708]|uniref:M-phase phosphoprotein 6 n=1 Tax=Sistotremastrum niveocremeum HHB9708 TaxID=1314777 RepID=A0A164MN33_9AGAM|nr:hypothetical protein SISNIDRAFT_491549 [Sistotremastrum niveocremeum HHB9708]
MSTKPTSNPRLSKATQNLKFMRNATALKIQQEEEAKATKKKNEDEWEIPNREVWGAKREEEEVEYEASYVPFIGEGRASSRRKFGERNDDKQDPQATTPGAKRSIDDENEQDIPKRKVRKT